MLSSANRVSADRRVSQKSGSRLQFVSEKSCCLFEKNAVPRFPSVENNAAARFPLNAFSLTA
jgi:hypothetical protein